MTDSYNAFGIEIKYSGEPGTDDYEETYVNEDYFNNPDLYNNEEGEDE